MNGINPHTVMLQNGVEMPLLGMGLYQLHGRECEDAVRNAVDLGYRLFDTAQMGAMKRNWAAPWAAAASRMNNCL